MHIKYLAFTGPEQEINELWSPGGLVTVAAGPQVTPPYFLPPLPTFSANLSELFLQARVWV